MAAEAVKGNYKVGGRGWSVGKEGGYERECRDAAAALRELCLGKCGHSRITRAASCFKDDVRHLYRNEVIQTYPILERSTCAVHVIHDPPGEVLILQKIASLGLSCKPQQARTFSPQFWLQYLQKRPAPSPPKPI